MITLDNWYIAYSCLGGYMANGIVYGHTSRHCPDGSQIHTSLIESAEFTGNELLIYTCNSEYHLSLDEMSCECFEPMRSLRVFERFAMSFDLSDLLDSVRERFFDMNRELMQLQQQIYDRLPDNSLYIELSDSEQFYFHLGLYRGEGGFREFIPGISDFDHDNGKTSASLNYLVEYRPYIGGNIEFIRHSAQSLPDSQTLGVIRNVGEKALNIRFSWGKTVIAAPDSEISVISGMGADIPLTDTSQQCDDEYEF